MVTALLEEAEGMLVSVRKEPDVVMEKEHDEEHEQTSKHRVYPYHATGS